jgi:hypothetical protein
MFYANNPVKKNVQSSGKLWNEVFSAAQKKVKEIWF